MKNEKSIAGHVAKELVRASENLERAVILGSRLVWRKEQLRVLAVKRTLHFLDSYGDKEIPLWVLKTIGRSLRRTIEASCFASNAGAYHPLYGLYGREK
jgi:hypothetical protein